MAGFRRSGGKGRSAVDPERFGAGGGIPGRRGGGCVGGAGGHWWTVVALVATGRSGNRLRGVMGYFGLDCGAGAGACTDSLPECHLGYPFSGSRTALGLKLLLAPRFGVAGILWSTAATVLAACPVLAWRIGRWAKKVRLHEQDAIGSAERI